jgi:hypothetical protein
MGDEEGWVSSVSTYQAGKSYSADRKDPLLHDLSPLLAEFWPI